MLGKSQVCGLVSNGPYASGPKFIFHTLFTLFRPFRPRRKHNLHPSSPPLGTPLCAFLFFLVLDLARATAEVIGLFDERDAASDLVSPHEAERRGFEVCDGCGVVAPTCEKALLVVKGENWSSDLIRIREL